jgi:hypothetical protein
MGAKIGLRLGADFEEDLCAMAEQELRSRGVPPRPWTQPRPQERRNVLRQLLTVEQRRITPQSRRSVWSDVLKTRAGDQWSTEAFNIASESEAADDLNHYLSTGVGRADPDAQLKDWGMTHLHLGGRQTGKAVSGRSDELLFIVVRPEELYFIDIGTHASFSELRLLEIVHRNWPHLIAHGRLNGVQGVQLTDIERAALRRKNANVTAVVADGTVYLAPGLGTVASGTSARIVMDADHMVEEAKQFQKVCESSIDGIVVAAAKLGVTLTERELDLHLVEFGSKCVAYLSAANFWLWMEHGSTELKMSDQPPPS